VVVASGDLQHRAQIGGRRYSPAWGRNKKEAEQRAAELKCKGAFAMGSLWMPCANEQALHKALQNQ
jgi:hypothetical protein